MNENNPNLEVDLFELNNQTSLLINTSKNAFNIYQEDDSSSNKELNENMNEINNNEDLPLINNVINDNKYQNSKKKALSNETCIYYKTYFFNQRKKRIIEKRKNI